MAFQGNVAMQVTQPGCQLWNQAMQVNQFATNEKIQIPCLNAEREQHLKSKYAITKMKNPKMDISGIRYGMGWCRHRSKDC